MNTYNLDRLRHAELYVLLALMFVLPTIESVKNILFFVYIVLLAVRVWRSDAVRPAPDLAVAAVALMFAIDVISIAINWDPRPASKALSDDFKFLGIFVAIWLARYSARELRWVALAIVAGTAVGLLIGVAERLLQYTPRLELHSVGPAVQAAIYVGVAFSLCAGLTLNLFRNPQASHAVRAAMAAAAIALLLGLAFMASRGAFFAVTLTAALALVFARNRMLTIVAALAGAATIAALFTLPNVFSQEDGLKRLSTNLIKRERAEEDVIRMDNWRVALKVFSEENSKLFGIGPRRFSSIQPAKYSFDPPLHPEARRHVSHGHNLFLTKLTEVGILGLAAFIFFLGYIAYRLVHERARAMIGDWVWFGALGAWVVPIAAGSFNAPFYQEHAFLAMTLFAIFLYRGADRGTYVQTGS